MTRDPLKKKSEKFLNIQSLWGALMIEELLRLGVVYFCVAPGSRSSPLITALMQSNVRSPAVHYDERGLAFYALGQAKASGRPSVVITTSGSAVANLFPAIVEARQSHIPMIFITADRPPELRQTGANQTIDQIKIFGNDVRSFFDLPCPDPHVPAASLLTWLDQAYYQSMKSPQGPVHINAMFREPLEPFHNDAVALKKYLIPLQAWQKTSTPYTHYAIAEMSPASDDLKELARCLQRFQKGVILVGTLKSSHAHKAILKLAEKLNWPLWPDITSGLRLSSTHSHIIPLYDQILLNKNQWDAWAPDCVVHIGGPIISKRTAQFLEHHRKARMIVINDHPERQDPHHRTHDRLHADINTVCSLLQRSVLQKRPSQWLRRFQQANKNVHTILEKTQQNTIDLNEALIASLVSYDSPKNSHLHLANSMPIRDMDRYAWCCKHSLSVTANRGASGIDGTIATALGFAKAKRQSLTLLIGDLAFLHDLNSLALCHDTCGPDTTIVIVLLNNNGGTIFDHLPIAEWSHPDFDKYFIAPHHLSFKNIAETFGLTYVSPKSAQEFSHHFQKAHQRKNKVFLIETTIDRKENLQAHRSLESSVMTVL